MYCTKCGAMIKETSKFCSKCGTPVFVKAETDSTDFKEDFSTNNITVTSKEETYYSSEEPFEDPYQMAQDSTPSTSLNLSQFKSSVKDFTAKATETASKTASQAKSAASSAKERIDKSSVKDFTAKATETASKAASQAKSVASSAKERIDKSIGDGVNKEIEKANSPKPEKAGLVSSKYSGANYMSTRELWTWLKKDSKRQQFFTDDISDETEEQYMAELTQKLEDNQVPVKIQKRNISWDRSDAKEQLFVAVPKTTVVNPLTYLIQFSHVGKFTFVEEKTFITPPDLPPVPHNKIPNANKGVAFVYLLILGIALLLIGPVLGESSALCYLAGVCFIGVACYHLMKIRKINEYNKKCDEELLQWNEAWDNWRTSIFLHSFQEDVNGQLSRIFDSVLSCINQINDEKFKDRKTLEVEDSSDMNELEQMISRKQAEYR